MLKFISWNVNGLRAAVRKGFEASFDSLDADFFCLQEIKLSEGQLELALPGYHQFYNYALRKGYSGTAIFTRREPLSVSYDMGIEAHDSEGRIITLEYPEFYLVTVYTPNSKRELERLDYRQVWEDDFRAYLKRLEEKHPVVVCGDLNVAHEDIDLANPKSNHRNAGFTDEERDKFRELLASGFVDTFRALYPDRAQAYSWWSNFANSRARNIGWRIDYFLISEALRDRLDDAKIHPEIMGSDHCPVEVTLKL